MDPAFRSRLPALILICMTQFMIPFDYLSITLSIVAIRTDLGMSGAMTPWIMSSYLLTFGGLLLLGGKLADLYGRRRMLIIGLLLFSFFSVATSMTTSPGFFLAARALKGVGSALICPAMLAILNTSFPAARDRHRALAVYWFCSVLGGAMGTGLGGFLTDYSWRLTLFINVPLALTLAALAPRILGEGRSLTPGARLDYGGAILSTLGIGAMIFAITNAMWFGLTLFTALALVISTTSFVALYRVERRHSSPIMPPHLFRLRNLIGANIFTFFWAAANSKYLIARFLQEVQHYTPGQAGLALLPHSVVSLCAAFVAVRVLDRFGAPKAMLLGALVEGAGIGVLCMVSPETRYLTILAGAAAIALGVSVAGIAAKLPACWDAEERDQGVASGMVFATQQIANAFAIPIYSAVMERTIRWLPSSTPDMALNNGYRAGFATALLFIVIAIVAALVFVRDRRPAAAVRTEAAPQPDKRDVLAVET